MAFDRAAWFDDEEAFARELARGRRTELAVATELLPLGLWLRVGALLDRRGLANHDDRLHDQADVEIEGGHLLEIKGRNFAFTGPDDFPYDTAFLGAARRWQDRTVWPCAVVLVSEPTGDAVVVPTTTRAHWTTARKPDSQRGYVQDTMLAPRHLLLPWTRLIGHLQRPCHCADVIVGTS